MARKSVVDTGGIRTNPGGSYAPPSPVTALTPIAGCSLENSSDPSFSFAFINGNQHPQLWVYQSGGHSSSIGAGWRTNDLMTQWPGTQPLPPPRSPGALSVSAFNYVFYVCYIDINGHIQAVPYRTDTSALWAERGPDLMATQAVLPASPDSNITSWTTAAGLYVVYVGSDGNLWELFQDWNTGGVQPTNLATSLLYAAPKATSTLATTTFKSVRYVAYMGIDGTIRILGSTNGQSWLCEDISSRITGTPPLSDSPLVVYGADFQDAPGLYFVYHGTDYSIRELSWNGEVWQPDQAIQTAGGTSPDTDLVGYACQYDETRHIIYNGGENQIEELYYYAGNWGQTDISFTAEGGPVPSPYSSGSALAGYSCELLKQRRAYYLDNLSRVRELTRVQSGKSGPWIPGEVAGP